MAQRNRTIVGVAVCIAFIILLVARADAGSKLSDVITRYDEARTSRSQTLKIDQDEFDALEDEKELREGIVSLANLALILAGLGALYLVNAGLAKKLGFVLATILFVAVLIYLIVRIMPGNPFEMLANNLVRDRGMNYTDALSMAHTMLNYDPDKPFVVGLVEYLGSLLRFDLGESWEYRIPVNDIISQALPWTLLVLATALLLSFTIGTFLGMVIAWKRRTALDPLITFYAAFTGATPDYITALVLLIIFAVNLDLFPITGGYNPRLTPGFNWPFISSVIHHSALPVIAYTFETTAGWALAMKGSAVSVLGEDYITAARARGLKDRRIMVNYVGRNAMLPMITALAISLGTMLAGSTLIENIYNYPGIGRFFAQSLTRRDLGAMQGLFLFTATAVIFANFVADLLYSQLDPRIKLED
jgi:peptide/nickel transport system permease protein